MGVDAADEGLVRGRLSEDGTPAAPHAGRHRVVDDCILDRVYVPHEPLWVGEGVPKIQCCMVVLARIADHAHRCIPRLPADAPQRRVHHVVSFEGLA